jgi:hypothetical protein
MQARYPGAKKCAPPTKPSHRCGSRLSPIVQWDPAVSFIFFPTLSRAGSHEDDDGGPLVDDDGGRWQRTSARVSLNPSPSSEHGKGPVGKAGRPGTRGWSWGSYRVLATVEAVGPSVCVCVCVWVGGGVRTRVRVWGWGAHRSSRRRTATRVPANPSPSFGHGKGLARGSR